MANLELKNISKIYSNKQHAVFPTNIKINDGEFIVILGPSGCGKSTLLRMVAGLEKNNEGSVLIDGKSVDNLEPSERDIAMVFQNYALYPHMTIYNNIAYCLKNLGIEKSRIVERVNETAKLLHLDGLLDRKPNQLSGGQRQRVAMGRAIVRNPKIFLFDEPLSNLDAKLRNTMRLEIKQLQSRLNTTCLYVTHDQVEAMTMADRLVVMNKGKVEQVGIPMDVYENPCSIFVAEFLGSPPMNLFQVNYDSGSNQVFIRGNKDLSVDSPIPNNLPEQALLGIRPEHIKINKDLQGLPAKLNAMERLGSDTLIHATFANSDTGFIIKSPQSDFNIQDETFSVNFTTDKIHFFDKTTETLIN